MFQLSGVVFLLCLSATITPAASQQCTRSQFKCDGQCVTPCDGIHDCRDGADETTALCSQFTCSAESSLDGGDLGNLGGFFGSVALQANKKFRCNYGGCISDSFKCNGRAHCWDASDETEELCSTKKCRRFEFRCNYGGCIRNLWKCDGKADCIDASDETELLCKSEMCSPSKPELCDYGACLRKNSICDGIIHCHDDSDETTAKCGANHIAVRRNEGLKIPEAETNPQPVTSPPPVLTPAPPPTPAPTPSPTPAPPPSPTPPSDPCLDASQCTCPDSEICVPCGRLRMCSSLLDGPKCSLPPHAEDSGITVDVLECGNQAIVNVAVFSRNHNALCKENEVPAQTIVIADCWGITTILAQCHEDGKWHPYGNELEENTMEPTPQLCQYQTLNSQVCGRRPRYRRPLVSLTPISAQQQWPWMASIYRNFTYACTGTVINQDYILTAAHCVTASEESTRIVDKRELTAQYLSGNGLIKSSYAKEVYIHPSYTGGSRPTKDVAILKVEAPVIFSHNVVPACVGTQGIPDTKIAATFHRLNKNNNVWEILLQKHDDRCHSSLDRCTTLPIETDQFCAIDINGFEFLGKGDSGGPYLVNKGNDVKERWTVDGIVSAASGVSNCKQPFTIFTRVSDFWPWINSCIHRKVCF